MEEQGKTTLAEGAPQVEAGPDSVIRLEGIHKSFGDNVVLDGIDLSVEAGETLVVIGASGSGKSTLLRCINLLEPIDSGRVFLEGEELTGRGVNVPQVRQRIGIVFWVTHICRRRELGNQVGQAALLASQLI